LAVWKLGLKNEEGTTAPIDGAKLGRLALERVFFEDFRHIHVSVSR
jgi:hypothetical protein